jgi:hypothetical protein
MPSAQARKRHTRFSRKEHGREDIEKRGTRYIFRYTTENPPNWRASNLLKYWRRGSGSNRRIKVLQTSPLPLGYRALGGLTSPISFRGEVYRRQKLFGAGDRGRTGDIFLGKEALYH